MKSQTTLAGTKKSTKTAARTARKPKAATAAPGNTAADLEAAAEAGRAHRAAKAEAAMIRPGEVASVEALLTTARRNIMTVWSTLEDLSKPEAEQEQGNHLHYGRAAVFQALDHLNCAESELDALRLRSEDAEQDAKVTRARNERLAAAVWVTP